MLPSQPPVELDCFIGLPIRDTKLTFRTDLVSFGYIVDSLQLAYDQCQLRPGYITVKGQHLWSPFDSSEDLIYGKCVKEVEDQISRDDSNGDE